MMNTTEENIREVFERFKENSIERVKKSKDYAFVHFKERDDALHAMNMLNGCELDGSIIEVTLSVLIRTGILISSPKYVSLLIFFHQIRDVLDDR